MKWSLSFYARRRSKEICHQTDKGANMKSKIELLLEQALTPMELPRQELNDQILQKIKERQNMQNNQVRYKIGFLWRRWRQYVF